QESGKMAKALQNLGVPMPSSSSKPVRATSAIISESWPPLGFDVAADAQAMLEKYEREMIEQHKKKEDKEKKGPQVDPIFEPTAVHEVYVEVDETTGEVKNEYDVLLTKVDVKYGTYSYN